MDDQRCTAMVEASASFSHIRRRNLKCSCRRRWPDTDES